MSNEAVCRTAPATPGLLIMTKYSGKTTVSVKEKNLIMIFFTTPQTMNKLKLCKITKCEKNQILAT